MNTYVVKVQNGHAYLYDAKTGGFKRSLGSQVVSAQITGEYVQVQTENGRVAVYNVNTGAYVRSL